MKQAKRRNMYPGYLYHSCKTSLEKRCCYLLQRHVAHKKLEVTSHLTSLLLRICGLEGRKYCLLICTEIPCIKQQVQNFMPLLKILQTFM